MKKSEMKAILSSDLETYNFRMFLDDVQNKSIVKDDLIRIFLYKEYFNDRKFFILSRDNN